VAIFIGEIIVYSIQRLKSFLQKAKRWRAAYTIFTWLGRVDREFWVFCTGQKRNTYRFSAFWRIRKSKVYIWPKRLHRDYKTNFKERKDTKYNVCAHSFGCRVAISLSCGGCVNKLLITGGAGLKPKFSIKKAFAKFRYKLAKVWVRCGLVGKEYLENFGSSDYKALPLIMKKTFSNIVNFYQNDMLKDIKCATLLVWGNKDSQTPLYMAKTMEKHIKDCGLVVFENCGHFAYVEKAYDFEKILNNFLKDWLWHFFQQII